MYYPAALPAVDGLTISVDAGRPMAHTYALHTTPHTPTHPGPASFWPGSSYCYPHLFATVLVLVRDGSVLLPFQWCILPSPYPACRPLHCRCTDDALPQAPPTIPLPHTPATAFLSWVAGGTCLQPRPAGATQLTRSMPFPCHGLPSCRFDMVGLLCTFTLPVKFVTVAFHLVGHFLTPAFT